jgi:hypothetical protein
VEEIGARFSNADIFCRSSELYDVNVSVGVEYHAVDSEVVIRVSRRCDVGVLLLRVEHSEGRPVPPSFSLTYSWVTRV